MSDFEFISIILSIVVGLTITRVLGGLASVVEHRRQLRMNWLSVGWSTTVLLWAVAFWLGTVNDTRVLESWTFTSFGTLLFLSIGLYFMAALVLPTRIDAASDLAAHFANVRRPFFWIFVVWGVVSTGSALIWGVENLIRLGPPFWIGQAATIGVGLLGVITADKRVHALILIVGLSGTVGFIVGKLYVI
jgi:hypothetical protein